MKASRYSVIEVTWLDSAQLEHGDWMTLDDVEEHADDLLQRSAGFVIHETEGTLVLARSISEWRLGEKVEGVLCIPKVCIVERA